VRFCVSPFFCAESKLSRKKIGYTHACRCFKAGNPALNRAPPAAVWWLPGCCARPARCGLRPCVWPQKAVGLSRRNLQSR